MAPIKPNAFLCFMREQKPILERRLGRIISMQELPALLNSEWQNMPSHLKEKYSNMSDKSKCKKEKLDSRGIPLRKIEEEKICVEKEETAMKKAIYSFVSPFNPETRSGIANLNIYVVSLQIYVKLANGIILPAEIGVVKFNIKKGIISEFHKIIKVDLPEGYYREISERSKNTHNLFENMNHPAIKGVAIEGKCIAEELKRYLFQDYNEDKEKIILFTPNRQRKVVRNFLEYEFVNIYSLDFLYMCMYNNSTDSDQIPISIAEDALNNSLYDYNLFPACSFHQKYSEDNSIYCALSEAKRYCYNICLHLDIKTRFGIEPVIGNHLPGQVRSEERVSCVLSSLVPAFKTTYNEANANKSKEKNVQNIQSQKDSVSTSFDQLSLISDVTESTTSVFLRHGRIDNEGIPAGINLLRGAWASPSTISSVKTADEDEFPALGASTCLRDSEGTKPLGVHKQFTAQSNVGLQGFGRGKSFSKRLDN